MSEKLDISIYRLVDNIEEVYACERENEGYCFQEFTYE